MRAMNVKRFCWGVIYVLAGLLVIILNRNIVQVHFFAYPAMWWCLGWAAVGVGAGLINTSNHVNGSKQGCWHYISYCPYALVFVTFAAILSGLIASGDIALSDVGVKFYTASALAGLGLGLLEDKLYDLLIYPVGNNSKSSRAAAEVAPPPNPVGHGADAPSSGLTGGLLAAAITSVALVTVNAWIVPTVARHQKRIDRMHQAMLDTAQSAGLLYGYTWRMWRERQAPSGLATNKPLENFLQVEAKAKALAFELPLIFDAGITTQWNAIVNGYGSPHGMSYKITQPKEFPLPTEEEMNKTLNPLTQSAGELVTKMQDMIREIENKLW